MRVGRRCISLVVLDSGLESWTRNWLLALLSGRGLYPLTLTLYIGLD